MVYANGYYLEITIPSLTRQIIKCYDSQTLSQAIMEAVIRYCGEIGLVDHSMLLSGVVTSEAIQKQFILSTKRRNKLTWKSIGYCRQKPWKIIEKLMMTIIEIMMTLTPQKTTQSGVIVDKGRVNVVKSKQSIGMKNSYTDRKNGKRPFVSLSSICMSISQIRECIFDRHTPV